MRKKLIVLLLALLALHPAGFAQRAADFREAADTLLQRMKRRGNVSMNFSLEKVLKRGGSLDFYFSNDLVSYPWREGDVEWFQAEWTNLAKPWMNGASMGRVYAKRQRLETLVMPALTRDGKPLPTSLRRGNPVNKPLVQGPDEWPKGLSGRHIALWQSHGLYWKEADSLWEWQRTANHRTIEDLYTQSYVLPFLIPMLEHAGAVVLTPRERDPQLQEVVCDNDPAFADFRGPGVRRRGSYRETGTWEDAGQGFADAKKTYAGQENPFTMGSARQTDAAASRDASQASAEWRPDIPEKGEYAVYVSYKTVVRSTPDARYKVHHLGGTTLLHVNQQMGGGTWVYLGTYTFGKGTAGYVELSNQSPAGTVITADAVRFGGGMGKVERNGAVSGYPAYIEGALYSMQYGGTPLSLFDNWEDEYTKDFAGRGAWVQHMAGGSRVNPTAEGKNIPIDLSLAFHTDAGITPNDSIVGTLGIYTLLCNGSEVLPNGESRQNGRLLTDLVQTQIVEDIRAVYEPKWTRRSLWDRSYSESRTTGVPGMLLELLSHQNFADMRYGLDPGFRFFASRAVYKGMLKYLSARYGRHYAVQPLPVHAFSARLDSNRVVLSWAATPDSLEATAAPDYYRVYTRVDDGAFGPGQQIEGTTCTLPIEKGHIYSYRITACNAGGESFPSEILAAGRPEGAAQEVLVVNDFTRVSAPTWFDTPLYAGFTDQLDSGVPWGTDLLVSGTVNQFDRSREWTTNDNPGFGGSYRDQAGSRIAGNSFDFAYAHGRALMDAGYAFSSSSAEAFDGTAGQAFALDLICGKQVTTRIGRGAVPDRYSVFPEALQQALRRFTAGGGHVLLSGSYIGTDAWDAIYQGVPRGNAATQAFCREVLGYKWVTNFGDNTGFVEPAAGSGLGLASYNRAWSPLLYRVENPDGLAPASTAGTILMRYRGSGTPAATFFNAGSYKVAAFGFPLESSAQMGDLIKNVLRKFSEGR